MYKTYVELMLMMLADEKHRIQTKKHQQNCDNKYTKDIDFILISLH